MLLAPCPTTQGPLAPVGAENPPLQAKKAAYCEDKRDQTYHHPEEVGISPGCVAQRVYLQVCRDPFEVIVEDRRGRIGIGLLKR